MSTATAAWVAIPCSTVPSSVASPADMQPKAFLGANMKDTSLAELSGAVIGNTAVIVDGGLAGVSATNTMLENGCKLVLLDKSSFRIRGNSTKATSGINGAATKTQAGQGIPGLQ